MIQTTLPKRQKRGLAVLAVAGLLLTMVLPAFTLSQVHAGQITDRSLTLLSGDDGGSAPSGNVNHLFEFTVGEEDEDVGSIIFEYCTTAAPVEGGTDCDTPEGMDASGAVLDSEDGAEGFSVDSADTNEIVIDRPVAEIEGETAVSYQFNEIINPETPNETFYTRISALDDDEGEGDEVYFGTVAASTTTEIELEGVMPESLVFCTGETIDTTDDVPDCTTATDGDVTFDQLFSATDTATATSQMAATTNAGDGYAITVNGPTLTSGSNEIDPMNDEGDAESPSLGTSQFGMNLVENDSTTDADDDPLGLDVDPEPNQDNYRGQPADNYDTEDLFKYEDGEMVANSYDEEPSPTDAQIFTKSYIVNVPGSQPAGTYTTTLTYVATATF